MAIIKIKNLDKHTHTHTTHTTKDPPDHRIHNEPNFKEDEERARKKQKVYTTRYKSTLHVSPTSNICERAFSRAKLIMTAQRRCMDPSTLDGLLFLRYNKDLWAVADIAIIMRDFKKEAAAAKRAEADRRAAAVAAGIPSTVFGMVIDNVSSPLSYEFSSSSCSR